MNFFLQNIYLTLIICIFIFSYTNQKNADNKFIVRLENYQHTQFYGPLYIGSSKQQMNFVFSTGSNDIWLMSSECKTCKSEKLFKPDLSTSFLNYTQSFFLQYSMGNVSGMISAETFNFIEDETLQLNTNNTSFLLVNYQNGFDNFKADGLVGLNVHNTPNKKNLIFQLYEQGHIALPRYSLYLSSTSGDSRLYIGDYSQNTAISNLYRQMNYCQVGKGENSWSCNINEIEINKKKIPVESKITIDSGISYLIIPISDFKIIKKQIIDETKSDCIFNENHQLLCRCENPEIFPNIKLKIEGNYFNINLSKLIDFFPKLAYSCRFEIFVDMNNFDNWIFGTNVMKDTIFSFDLNSRKLGFNQNPDLKSLINKENLIIYNDDKGEPKIGYILAIVFIILLLFSIIKCANNDKFMIGSSNYKSDSFELGNMDDMNKLASLKKNLNNTDFENYNYKNFKDSKNNNNLKNKFAQGVTENSNIIKNKLEFDENVKKGDVKN